MKTYLFTFQTNYEEAGIIITTSKGLDYAKKLATEKGAWNTNSWKIIDTTKEDFITTVNYG